jgi:hypothetical protein
VPISLGLDYGHAGQNEITGGSPYGVTTIAGGDGSRQRTENELRGARYQGRKIAATANKLTRVVTARTPIVSQATMNSRYLPFIGRVNWSAVRHEPLRRTRGLRSSDDGDDQRGRTSVPATRVRGGRRRRVRRRMLLILRHHVRPVPLALDGFSLGPAISFHGNFAGHNQMIHFSKT